MSLSWTSAKHWLSVAATAFIGAAVGYESSHFVQITSGQWKLALVGGALAGVAAVVHLAQIPGTTNVQSQSTEVK